MFYFIKTIKYLKKININKVFYEVNKIIKYSDNKYNF